MSSKNETISLILALLITGAIVGAGLWWFTQKSGLKNAKLENSQPNNNLPSQSSPSTAESPTQHSFNAPKNVPSGTAIAINGSTSMVQINQVLKNSFEKRFPGTQVIINAQGSDTGIKLLQTGNIDIAAISRPLSDSEINRGLVAIPIVGDAIAIVVGIDNPFRRSLNDLQLRQIFQGEIINWSEVGGKSSTIKVIDRPNLSGTRQVFQQEVLQGENFGSGNNFVTMNRDATTPILQALGNNGISYATYTQVANQQTVRIVAINGLTPEAENYPYQRTLYYVYQNPPSSEVAAFLGYALSFEGKSEIVKKRFGITF
jgi:phosphate transport system substrate-binding protein